MHCYDITIQSVVYVGAHFLLHFRVLYLFLFIFNFFYFTLIL